MSRGHSAGFVALLPPLFLMAALRPCPANDGPPKSYPSPKAVFDAYREARARRDYRTCFSLWTRKLQDDAVFEAYFTCRIKESKETDEILKRFGVDWETMTSDLMREHKAKHGIEPTDEKALWDALEKEYKVKHGVPPAEEPYLLTDILSRLIKDKAGFVEAASKVPAKPPVSPIGDIEEVVIQGDTATGHMSVTVYHHETPPGGAPRKVEDKEDKVDKTFRFRKVNGSWLLDSL